MVQMGSIQKQSEVSSIQTTTKKYFYSHKVKQLNAKKPSKNLTAFLLKF